MRDEPRQVMGDLGVTRFVCGGGGADGAHGAGLINLDDIGRHNRLQATPDERAGGHEAERQAADC